VGERYPSHYVPELSRRARGFATWAMLKHLGRSGIEALVERCCASAADIARALSREPGILVANEVVLNQVVVRFGADLPDEQGDDLTRRTIDALQRDGELFAGGATWRGRQVMRLSVTNHQTDLDEAKKSAEAIVAAYRSARRSVMGA
jgi:glutamate/tyrosine decarboxylase-like PLP-dependent enzyme